MLGIFLDSETNGLNPKTHHILEIAFHIVDLLNGDVKERYQAVIQQNIRDWEKSDPESLKINGFTWEDVYNGKPLNQVAQEITDLFGEYSIQRGKAVFICQNPSFDRVFFSQIIDPKSQDILNWPYHWLDLASMHWALSIYKKETFPWVIGLSKDKIANHYKIPPEEKPHKAENGVTHLIACYRAVVGFPKEIT